MELGLVIHKIETLNLLDAKLKGPTAINQSLYAYDWKTFRTFLIELSVIITH